MKKVLAIVGPTAVGKTDFGIECANVFDGEIISGDSIQIVWDGEEDAVVTVTCPRTAPTITATIDRDDFVAAADASGTYNFYFTTEWSDDPEDYGITVTGTPASQQAAMTAETSSVLAATTTASGAKAAPPGSSSCL